MSRYFQASGLGATSAAQTLPSSWTLYAWAYNPSNASGGRVADHNTSATNWARPSTNDRYTFQRQFATTNGVWELLDSTHGVSVAGWHHIAVTHDGSSVANAPIMYVNGQPFTMSQTTAPVGAVNTTFSGTFYVGNRAAGGRAFGSTGTQGGLAWFGWHNAVLTQEQVQDAMVNGYTSSSAVHVWPIYGDNTTEPNLVGSPTLNISGSSANKGLDPPVPLGRSPVAVTRARRR